MPNSIHILCLKRFLGVGLLLVTIVGCRNKTPNFYSESDYRVVPKIDAHIHVSAKENLFEEQAKQNGFQLLNIVVGGSSEPDTLRKRFDFRISKKKEFPDLYEVATSFSVKEWDQPHWATKTISRLEEDIKKGAIAVKVWKNIGMVLKDSTGQLVMVDHPKLDTIFNYLAQKDIPVIGHLGEPKNCWLPLDEMTVANDSIYYSEHPQYHMYKQPEFPSYQDQIDARDRMLEKHPDLTFIGAHLGSLEWSVDELANRLDRFPNMSVDMAARIGQIFYQTIEDREKVRDFFIKYQDRILYATDLGYGGKKPVDEQIKLMQETWKLDWEFLVTDKILTNYRVSQPFQGLKLPREVVDKIYYGNAQKWLNMFADKD